MCTCVCACVSHTPNVLLQCDAGYVCELRCARCDKHFLLTAIKGCLLCITGAVSLSPNMTFCPFSCYCLFKKK